jgi:SWIM zinc finger
MALTRGTIEAMAPDQSALKAAAGLLKPKHWPARARAGGLIWGECQGSGANPYRVAADTEDPGSKCTCPSRKFPCKHALALMWMFVDDAKSFPEGATPDWVQEWMGRRRKSTLPTASSNAKSLDTAAAAEPASAPDPEAEGKRRDAAARRAAETRESVRAATEDLELWVADQLRTGLSGFLGAAGERCRRIAARLVDAKAAGLASRIDEMPSRLLGLPAEERIDAAIAELGKLILLARAWRASPLAPDLRREVITAETREEVLAGDPAIRVTSCWEVLGERILTRRDGLVSHSTWLLNLQPVTPSSMGPPFALLLDFFPASAGRRRGAFVAGERFAAELAFYPGPVPLRAIIAARQDSAAPDGTWPEAAPDPFTEYAAQLLEVPWLIERPLLLPAGRLCLDAGGRPWWQATDGLSAPLREMPPLVALGTMIEQAAGLWDGARLSLLAAETNWGRLGFDA